MKTRYIRICALLLTILMLLPIVACTTTPPEASPAFTVTTQEGGACRIIYPAGDVTQTSAWRALANKLARVIHDITGVTLTVAPDSEAEVEGQGEILLGDTSRSFSYEAKRKMSTDKDFGFVVSGDCLAVVAKDKNAAALAIEYFAVRYADKLGATLQEKSLTIPSTSLFFDLPQTGQTLSALFSAQGHLTMNAYPDFGIRAEGAYQTAIAQARVGGTLYTLMANASGEAVILKGSAENGKTETVSEPLGTKAAQSLCYNSAQDLLAVLCEQKTVLLVEPTSLKVVRTITMEEPLELLAYDACAYRYAAKPTEKQEIVFYDNQLKETGEKLFVGSFEGVLQGAGSLLAFCVDDAFAHLLIGATTEGKTQTALYSLSLDGKKSLIKACDIDGYLPLALFFTGEVFYATVRGTEGDAAVLYHIDIEQNSSELSDAFNERNTATADTSFLTAKRLFAVSSMISSVSNYKTFVMQGSCTDGKYGYFMLEDQKGDYNNSAIHRTTIVKVDMETGEYVAHSDPLPLGHSNDACYNPVTGQLVISYNGNDKTRVMLVDAETLTITGEKRCDVNFFAIAYNPTTGGYIIGLSGGRNFALIDSEFHVTKTIKNGSKGSELLLDYEKNGWRVTQGITADSKYVYFVFSCKPGGEKPYQNLLCAFDYEGNHQFTKVLPDITHEGESIFFIGTTLYVTVYSWGTNYCYEITISQ